MPLKGKRKKSYNKNITNKTRMKYMSAGRKFTTKFRKKVNLKLLQDRGKHITKI